MLNTSGWGWGAGDKPEAKVINLLGEAPINKHKQLVVKRQGKIPD